MNTLTLRTFIVLGSLAMNAVAQAGAFDLVPQLSSPGLKPAIVLPEKAPEIARPVLPAVISPVQPRLVPFRPIHKADCSDQSQLAITGTDDGCIKKPGKPIRPIPTQPGVLA